MKFLLNSISEGFLACDACGGEDFLLASDTRIACDRRFKNFLLYECRSCGEAGFWTHDRLIDKKRRLARAFAKKTASARATQSADEKTLVKFVELYKSRPARQAS